MIVGFIATFTFSTPLQKYKIMKRFIFLLMIIPLWSQAQLIDGFSDGDFTNNPAWTGTAEKYIINADKQLQLNAIEAGTAWLSTPYTIAGNNMEWRFWIRLAFSPSGSNYSLVYLSSDQADLSGPLNGYFLRFGEAGSNDAIELLKQQGTTTSVICRGTEAALATSFALFVKVVRKQNGDWSIFTDPGGTGIYIPEASGNDNSFQPGGYFGVFGQFTVSNSTKMYYDEIYAGSEVIDTEPPVLLAALATGPESISLTFNEAIELQSLTNPLNYSIDQGIGHPAEVLQGITPAHVVLQLPEPLENGRAYRLTISNITDLNGNTLASAEADISFYVALANDIVINEVMADPSPVVGLPEWEYIELYNPTNLLISLDNFKLLIGSTEKLISQVQMPAGSYLILAHEDARAALSAYGNFYGFSSFQLANTAAVLSLVSNQGLIVNQLSYTDNWYGDAGKKDGGWSLEQIDPENPCGGSSNWKASNDPSGGTPGVQNSIYSLLNATPKPAGMKLIANNIVQLWFDQQMNALSLANPAAYTLEPGNINPIQATTNPADPAFVELVFGASFSQGILYTLSMSEQLTNCAGRPVADGTSITFGLPDTPESGDVVINEVLFHPFDGGVDFVEIYNRSQKLINLEDLRLGGVRQTIPNPPDTTLKVITTNTRLLLPGTWALLTSSGEAVTVFYPEAATENFVIMESLPSFSNESGTVLLVSKTLQYIDGMTYHEDMHYPLLNYVDGVSLERISAERPSSDPKNWHSAAQTAGWATPGYQNSLAVEEKSASEGLTVDPETFSPDGDGYQDVTSFRYAFGEGGYTLNIHIYNAAGQHVAHLVKSELVSATGAVSWDGLDDNRSKVPTGIYVVYAEAFAPDGRVTGYKKAVAVATR